MPRMNADRLRGKSHRARTFLLVLSAVVLAASSSICAAGIDHPVTPTDSGIWARQYSQGLQYAAIVTEIGGALWLGGWAASRSSAARSGRRSMPPFSVPPRHKA